MSGDRLSALQWRILRALSGVNPQWTLAGGAALAGFHLRHRRTRDLDLFWRARKELGEIPRIIEGRLSEAGLSHRTIQTSPTFHRLIVEEASETCVVDLVAEPTASVEPPILVPDESVAIAVDSPHEILVDKLCTLLSRSELRDLVDTRELMNAGSDLPRAVADAPKKDAGFSPVTLAWVLKSANVEDEALASGLARSEADALARFRDSLVERLLALSAPGDP